LVVEVTQSTDRELDQQAESTRLPETVNHAENEPVIYHSLTALMRHHQICGTCADWLHDERIVGDWLVVNSLTTSPELDVNELALLACVVE
jgi:hypothetical protein